MRSDPRRRSLQPPLPLPPQRPWPLLQALRRSWTLQLLPLEPQNAPRSPPQRSCDASGRCNCCFPGLCNAHNAPRSQLQLLPEPLNAPRSLHQQRSSAHSAYSQCRQSFLQRSDASRATGTLLHRATCLTLPLYDRGILHRKEPHG